MLLRNTFIITFSLSLFVNAFSQELVKDINPSGSSLPTSLTSSNGKLFFVAFTSTTGTELWKSDGSSDGTLMVKELSPGKANTSINYITDVNGIVFFNADVAPYGPELWKSDGSLDGTVLVKEINPATGTYGGSNPNDLLNINGTLFFNATNKTNGEELWKSDGTSEGTVLVKDINPGFSGSNPHMLTNVGGILYFIANGDELHKSDGTTAGTVLVKDLSKGTNLVRFLTNVNGTLFFSGGIGGSATDKQLWKSDASETVMLKDIGGPDGAIEKLTNINGLLYFTVNDGINGLELWKSDGTIAGTIMLKDINPGSGNAYFSNIVEINNLAFFTAFDGDKTKLWMSNGTTGGTVMVNTVPDNLELQSELFVSNNTLFFKADDGNGNKVWKMEGIDLNAQLAWSTPIFRLVNISGVIESPAIVSIGNTLYYRSTSFAGTGEELYKYPATTVGLSKPLSTNFLGIKAYPSPTLGLVNIELKEVAEANLELYNISGEHLYSQKINGTHKLDISNLVNGFYYLKLETKEGQITYKIILNK